MSTVISSLYGQLQQFSHLQQLHSVLSADLRSCRERVLKETKSVRRELTFYRWCQRRNLSESYPFPRGTSYINKGLDYDRLLFYRKLICYLHDHPLEFSKIIVSLPMIKTTPLSDSLESLYFDKERDLAECIAFDIMLSDINSLTLLLRSILLNSKTNINRLSQKLFQLFIVIICHKLINTTFRSLLNRLYRINEKLSFQKLKGTKDEIINSTLYKSCDDVLNVIILFLRILPIPLRHCISVMTEENMITSPSNLLEWLLSTIFSPLLLQPDDWYLVICNPSKDETTNNNNIQSIVTTLLQLCRAYSEQQNDDDKEDIGDKEDKEEDSVELTHLLLLKHGSTLSSLLNIIILNKMGDDIKPSDALVPSNGSPELFIWHKILIKMSSGSYVSCPISDNLIRLCLSCNPPQSIGFRPWITIQLPTINFVMDTESGNMINTSIDDILSGNPSSSYLSPYIFKPIRVFLLSLSMAQCLAVPLDIFTSDINDIKHLNLNLNTQQVTLLYFAIKRINDSDNIDNNNLGDVFTSIVTEYRDIFCKNLYDALSTHNVVSSLNYIQNKEETLRELRRIFIESHENLQMRDILYLSKQNIPILRLQIEKIMYSLSEQQITSIDEGSDWMNDKFVVFRTTKCISKTRNALIRFLNDYGIGRVDFKVKFGGSVLDFTNKRISRVLVNAIIFEIRDIFWNRCPIEDGKFKFQIIELNDKYGASLSTFFGAFLNKKKSSSMPSLSAKSIEMMVNNMSSINDDKLCQTIGDFEDCIATVRDALITCINGADCGDGDDYMPLFCYILMKSMPSYLPSQLQTTKVISQRKIQDKYFIDCCVAMKALRNFCNVTFQDHQQSPPQQQPKQSPPQSIDNNNITTTKSIFNTLKSKVNTNTKKGFFNLSPTSSFSAFINKTQHNNTKNNGTDNDDNNANNNNNNDNNDANDNNNNNNNNANTVHIDNIEDDEDIMVEVKTKL